MEVEVCASAGGVLLQVADRAADNPPQPTSTRDPSKGGMGLGMIAIVALLWLRLGQPTLPDLPEGMALPDGAQAQAVTFARDWIVVVTDAGEVLLYDRSGALRDRVQP